jgi:hypothetical protein
MYSLHASPYLSALFIHNNSISPTVYVAAFTGADPKSAKKTDNLTVFFVLLGSACVKARRKMMVTLTPCDKENMHFVVKNFPNPVVEWFFFDNDSIFLCDSFKTTI